MDYSLNTIVNSVRDYWNDHPLGIQYIQDPEIEIGSPKFFAQIQAWMNPYKFPWIMDRIEREASLLKGKHLLEAGCGMGFDSLEFIKRGVIVTATDLTPNAVQLTRRHFELEGVQAEDVRVANLLDLPYDDDTFDAVWANGVVHHTGNAARAVQGIRRVLKPGGRAIISHFYRRPSWMYFLHRLGRENIEAKEEDPPVTEFLTEEQILALFEGFEVVEAVQEHYRAHPIRRRGRKAALYTHIFKPIYNALPESIARRFAYKFSVTGIKV